MKKGFFLLSKSQNKQPIPRIPKCGLCGLYKHCLSPKMKPTGQGRKKILVVAEAPGEKEDKLNTQLIGKSGQYFRNILKELRIDLDKDCWKTNAVICRREGNKTPDSNMIDACRPNLMSTIKEYQPNVIILLGAVAVESLISIMYKSNIGSVSRWGGYYIPCIELNAWIIPTYHPSFLLRTQSKALNIIFKKHIEIAISKTKNKPWSSIPDYAKEIEIINKPSQAAKIIKEMIRRKGVIAFDYETNMLKPDSKLSEIVSCSICWKGKKTIAYLWSGEAIDATIEILKSPIPKIASNMKFEDRWTKAKLGFNIKNWYWDTMLAAHIINNSTGAAGLKFQAFVLLGQGDYNSHIEPFLKGDKNGINRIHQIDKRDLLLYNGLDSLLEYKVAMKQIKILEKL